MKQFCKNHKFLCAVVGTIIVFAGVNLVYFLTDSKKHSRILNDAQAVVAELNDTPGYTDYISGIAISALRGCGRGQEIFGRGALQCDTRIELEGEIFGAWQAKHLLLSVDDTLSRHGFAMKGDDVGQMIPDEDTEYLHKITSVVHTPTATECGMRYEYLNDEERNQRRMHPAELPYFTLTMGCDDMARLEQLLDREIL